MSKPDPKKTLAARPLHSVVFWTGAILLGACNDGDATAPQTDDDTGTGAANTDTSTTGSSDTASVVTARRVIVLVDGSPEPGVIVKQGGSETIYSTLDDGTVEVTVDTSIDGEWVFHASHPEARIGFAHVDRESDDDMRIELTRMAPGDNEDYTFVPPGTPDNPLHCSHCHRRIDDAWYESPHRRSASNPKVQDLYAGVASAIALEDECLAAGGRWWPGLEPGTGQAIERCYLGAGTLPDLNTHCGDDSSCDEVAENFGACADCHAPGINGKLGGRDLLEARGVEHDFGVHCDVCHQVESIDMNAPPGVGGRLVIKRPTEQTGDPEEPYALLSFGPYSDVGQIGMGAVQREIYRQSEYCAGCHEQTMAIESAVGSIDLARWPDGVIPVQSSYSEWAEGPANPAMSCVGCHMPGDPEALNSSDLERYTEVLKPGMVAGWERPQGTVRAHSWIGPRQPASGMLQLAATLDMDTTVDNDTLTARITVTNVNGGHALPTGETMRSVILLVDASCGDDSLVATAGPVVPDFGGWRQRKELPEDWNTWPGAKVGDVVRVIERSDSWYDYNGFGPFGPDGFSPEEKGMAIETATGQSTITAITDGVAEFDAPLPEGDVAYLGDSLGSFQEDVSPPEVLSDSPTGSTLDSWAVAGSPGFAFARVMVGADGQRMVPHFRAVDVASDNRLLPQQGWTGEFQFAASCQSPDVRAVMLYRPYPLGLATERRWEMRDTIIKEVSN